jgi:hypothetical protein
LPIGLARTSSGLVEHPRPARFRPRFGPGVDGSDSRAALQRPVNRYSDRSFSCPPATNLPWPVWLVARNLLAFAERDRRLNQIASLRFSFPFSVIQPSPRIFGGCRPPNTSRFDVRSVPAVLGATPLRQRLTSFALTTVDRNRSCVTGLFLGGVPLSIPHGIGLVGPVGGSSCEGRCLRVRQRSWDFKPFAALILSYRAKTGSPRSSVPHAVS